MLDAAGQAAPTLDAPQLTEPFRWPSEGVTRAPYRLFSDPEIYALEQARIFRGPVWSFLCLEVEIPNPGDYRTTTVGDCRSSSRAIATARSMRWSIGARIRARSCA